ncbi:MAG: hypothetical protein NWS30_04015, partial [Verrucomicrobiales bacterium]|nr:hypothetical protein [Verrucomicrobiales bacterium]
AEETKEEGHSCPSRFIVLRTTHDRATGMSPLLGMKGSVGMGPARFGVNVTRPCLSGDRA